MSKSLILPQRFAKKSQQKQEKSQETPILEKLPEPTGWRILVLPYKGKGKTEGEALATVCALVLKVGPLAYKDTEKFGESGAWCKEQDWVIFGRYAGSRFRIDGGEVRLLNDDEILARINDPADILHL